MIYLILTSDDNNNDSYSWVIMKNKSNDNDNINNSYLNSSIDNKNNQESEKENGCYQKENDHNDKISKKSSQKNSDEEFLNNSIGNFKIILRERSKSSIPDKLSDIESGSKSNDEQKKLIPHKFDIERFNYYKHSYIKNISQKIKTYDSIFSILFKGILKVTSKPWELFMDLFVPKSNEGFSLILGFLIPMFFIWNFSELELFILEKVLSRLKVPASFLGFTIMSWGNNAPDMY